MFGSCQTVWDVLGPFSKVRVLSIMLSDFLQGVHRAVVSCCENSQDVHRMLTQTDILRWYTAAALFVEECLPLTRALQNRQQIQPWPLAGTFRTVFGGQAAKSLVTVTTGESALEAYR